MNEIRVSTEFYEQLLAITWDLDQFDHVKIRTPVTGTTIYFAIGDEPPVGEDEHYDEVVPYRHEAASE